jgi:hypothetical protein
VLGDCLFYSAAFNSGDPRSSITLRKEVIKRMTSNAVEYQSHIEINDEVEVGAGGEGNYKPYDGWENYLSLMSEQTTWAGHVEILALADVLQRPIVVLEQNTKVTHDPVIGRQYLQNANPIFVGRVNGNHYEPLILPPGKDGMDIIAQIDVELDVLKAKRSVRW